ncbi:MAG: phage tail length tape measure family protein [Proteobacteria bacterium]|nr:phage tail length tape measure family protein [Pseudomonadota bacterium]
MAGTKAQLEISADASGVEVGVARAKRSLADLGVTVATQGKRAAEGIQQVGQGADTAASRVDAATRSLANSIQRTIATTEAGGRSTRQFYESLAQQRGVSTEALRPYLDQLDAVVKKQREAQAALNAANVPLQKVGVSAAQTAAALRGVPAQFTDIITSLQGGQQPLTVLLQQGGQLKDMFGGIGPAASALGGYVASLVTPFTVAAAAAAALAVAMYQGSQEAVAYAKALTLSGNAVGLTTDQLKGLAADIARVTGTQGDAANALAALAGSGKVATSSLTSVGQAVVSMNRVLGTSVEEATAMFAKLADEPTKGSQKLNESMHYLTQSTYERIRALEEQGRKEEATALAQGTLANEMTARLGKIEAQAGVLSTAWRLLAQDAKKAWDMMMGLGRPQTTGEALASAQQLLADRQARGPTNDLTGDAFARGNARLQDRISSLSRQSLREIDNAWAEGERARDQAAKIAATDRLKTLSDEVRSNADKRKKAIADLDRDFKTLGKATSGAEYDKLVANINEKFKDPKEAKGKAFQDDAATKYLETLKQSEASLREQLEQEGKLTDAAREQAKFQQLIADLKDKKVLTADQKSLLANKDAISAQLEKNAALSKEIEFKKKLEEIDKKAKQDAREFAQQVEAINLSIASAAQARAEQNDRALSAFGLGDRAREQVAAQKSIYAEFQRYQLQLNKQAADKGQLGSPEYEAEAERIKAALKAALGAQSDYFDALKEKQADWRNGATTALANYIDEVENAAQRAQDAVTQGLRGLDDALTGAILGEGGDGFKNVGKQLAQQIVKGFVQTSVTKPLAQMFQDSLKDSDSWISKVLGTALGGKSIADAAKGTTEALGATSLSASQTALAATTSTATAALGTLAAAASAAAAAMGSNSIGSALKAANLVGASGGDSLGSLISLMGWADGGYTGDGGKYDPAGIVHAGEFVINAESVKKLGVGFLEKLNRRGYADGGYVTRLATAGTVRQGGSQADEPQRRRGEGGDTFVFGDIPTASAVRQEIARSRAASAATLYRSQRYGGTFST